MNVTIYAPGATVCVRPFYTDWSAPDPAQRIVGGRTYFSQCAINPYALQRSNIGDRTRFEVRSGDRWAVDGSTNVERSELAGYATLFPADVDIWAAYSFRLSGPISTADWVVLGQFKGKEEAGGALCGWELKLPGTRLRAFSRASTQDPPGSLPALYHSQTSIYYDAWHNVVMRVRFNATSGLFHGWFNGAQIVNYAGPIGLASENLGYYWKHGIYRVGNPQTLIAEYANMECGTVDLSARISNPRPV